MKNISTDIASFTALLASDVPGCPSFLKESAIRKAAREFFKQTRSWRETVENYTLYKNDKEIPANTLAKKFSSACVVLEVNDMWISEDGAPLSKISTEVMDKNISGWKLETADQPTGYCFTPQGMIRIYPAMADDSEKVDVDIELILIPTLAMTIFPDFAYNLHGEILAAGAAKQLLMLPNQPWSDPARAGYFSGIYKEGLQAGRYEEAKRVVDALNAANREYFR